MFPRNLAVLALGALLAGPAAADLVFLKSGKILGGEVSETDAGLQVTSADGSVTIAHALVERFELGRGLEQLVRDKFAGTARDADALYQLGRWFAGHGLGPAADKANEMALAADAEHLLARRAKGQVKRGGKWISHRQLVREAGLVQRGGRWTLPAAGGTSAPIVERAPEQTGARLTWAEARLPAVVSEVVSASGPESKARAEVGRRQVVRSLVEVLLRGDDPRSRAKAAAILGHNAEVSAVPSLVRSAVADRDRAVRHAAVAALDKVALPSAPFYFIKPLESPRAEVRENAIEALGMIQNNNATEVLVKTLVAVYGGGPRVYIFIGSQNAYIKDYDVEVAEDAAVADPEVGYVMSGAVLEFKILRIMEYVTVRETQLIAKALQKRTGQQLGPDPQRWVAWWKKASKDAAKRQ